MIEVELSRRGSLLLGIAFLIGLLALAAFSPALRAGGTEPAAEITEQGDSTNVTEAIPLPAGISEEAPTPSSVSLEATTQSTATLQIVTPDPNDPAMVAPEATTQVMGTVTAQALHVRTGPGADFASLTTLTEADTVRVQGQNEVGTWLQVILADGQIGWVNAAYLTLPTTKPLPVISTGGES